MSSSLRKVAARVRTAIFPSVRRRPISSHGNGPLLRQPDKDRRPLIEHAPGWNHELATPSEAFIKADRETASIDDMRKKTLDYMHRSDPDVERTHATYARDEVGGPLGTAGVGEFEGVVGSDDLGPDDVVQVESNGRIVTRHASREKTSAHEGESGSGAG